MDEPVEPPFTPRASSEPASPTEKLVIEMPFNNDITFPISMVQGETVVELQRRIATAIGVDHSRVLITKRSPSLQSDLPVEMAAQDNKLQLVVRSSFDFERLRKLIEADRYLPILPPQERPESMPSPFNSPEMGNGFPWRSNTSLLGPRRQLTPVRQRKALKIKLDDGATLEIDDATGFTQSGSDLLVSPSLDEKLRALGIGKVEQQQPTAREVISQLARNAMRGLTGFYNEANARGVFQLGLIFGILFLIVEKALTDLPLSYTLPVRTVLYATTIIYIAIQVSDRPISMLDFISMPPIYAESQDIRTIDSLIPEEYRKNTDIQEKTQLQILNSMRKPLSYLDILKILLVSFFPTLYGEWARKVELRKEAHLKAIKMAAQENIKIKETQDQARYQLENEALQPADQPTSRTLLGEVAAESNTESIPSAVDSDPSAGAADDANLITPESNPSIAGPNQVTAGHPGRLVAEPE